MRKSLWRLDSRFAAAAARLDRFLDVLEELFDNDYVSPRSAQSRRAALHAELADLGKALLKGTTGQDPGESHGVGDG